MAKPSWRDRFRGTWRRIINLDDSPHRIALGVALGTLVAYQPLMGAQMMISAALCRVFGGNVVASLPWAFITNPLTALPIYYLTWRLGAAVLGAGGDAAAVEAALDGGLWAMITQSDALWGDVLWPLVLGGLLLGAANALPLYLLVLRLVRRRRRSRAALTAPPRVATRRTPTPILEEP